MKTGKLKYYKIAYLILLGISVVSLFCEYSIQEEKLKENLKEEFRETLLDEFEREVNEYNFDPISSGGDIERFDTVIIQSKDGILKFPRDTIKEKRNIAQKSLFCAFHSTLFQKNRISPDSIYLQYTQYLEQEKLSANTAMLFTNYKNDTIMSGSKALITPQDSLTTYYAGYGSEYTFTVYGYPAFCSIILACNMFVWVLFILVLGALLFILQKQNTKASVSTDEPTEQGYVLRQKVYYFHNQATYNDETRELCAGEKKEKLRNQVAFLFVLFLKEKDFILSSEQILNQIWPEGNGTDDKRRNLIRDLRSVLPSDYFVIDSLYKGQYQLRLIYPEKNGK